MLFIAYGSLRQTGTRGFNNGVCGPQRHIRTLVLDGFTLHDLGVYPAVALTPDEGKLTCELHEISEQTAENIAWLEKGTGYSAHTVSLPEGDATIWVMDRRRIKDCPVVKSGDWA